jgi:hypothetical protein
MIRQHTADQVTLTGRYEMKAKLMIARFPGSNQEDPESTDLYVDLVRRAEKDPRISETLLWKMSDTPITMSRNRCLKEAALLGVDYVIMLDADMGMEAGEKPFYETAMNFLFGRSAPALVAAPYCGPAPNSCVYVFTWRNLENPGMRCNDDFQLRMFEREEVYNRKGIEPVAALPTGLMLIDMRLITGFTNPKTNKHVQLPPPWFKYEWTDKFETDKSSTEDVYFSRNASLIGCENFVTWDCWHTHYKRHAVHKPQPINAEFVTLSLKAAEQRPNEQLLILNTK